jgi:hypothetical protein
MFGIYQRLRKTLLEEGRLQKYLVYAIGEIILVVMGILIALAINNRRQWERDRQDEKIYLSRLVEDLSMDNVDIKEANLFAYKRIAISTWVLEQLGDSSANFEPKFLLKKAAEIEPINQDWTKDSLGLAITRLLSPRIFDHNEVTFQEMISTSKIQVIQDLTLRSAINRHYIAARKALSTNNDVLLAQQNLVTALKSIGLTPNTIAAAPGLIQQLKGNRQIVAELNFIRDMAEHHLEIFERPERGLYVKTEALIQKINGTLK